ncbi:MAG TPA: ABC transporter permease [Longimicrobiales bacterium]
MTRRLPPEIAALSGAVVIWIVFALVAGPSFRSLSAALAILNAAAPLGILAIAVALLMIGGEFDLSVGSIIGAAGMTVLVLTRHFTWPLLPALLCALIVALAVGALNGLLVTRTRLPSLIVTLGTMFMVRGLTIALTRLLTRRTQLGGLSSVEGYDFVRIIFGSSVVWCVLAVLVATWVLQQTHWGNWIYAVGGNDDAARRSGVPVERTKIALFMTTALAAWLVGVLQAVQFTGADALRGTGQEFLAIVAAVIGGTLLTGGYGSAIGAVLGALIFGMVQQGIVISGIDADWFQVFLGIMLVAAVIANNYVRRRVAEVH